MTTVVEIVNNQIVVAVDEAESLTLIAAARVSALGSIETAQGAAQTAVAADREAAQGAISDDRAAALMAIADDRSAALTAIGAAGDDELGQIGTAGDNELAAIGAAGDAEEASITALAATKRADILTTVPSQGPYAYAHASALPRGITGVTSLIGGSGGTNGTFTGSASGGSFTGVEFTFVVAGGALTSVTFTNGGINLTGGTTVPTLSFAASAGLTGASATAVASPKVATQGTYLAASADGKALMLWRNDGTSTPAAVLDANGLHVGYISKSGLDAMFDQTVVTESGWALPFADKDGLVLGGFDADGYLRAVQAILPATQTFTDDDLTTPLGSRIVPGGAGISFVRTYDECGYALAVVDANDLIIFGVSNLGLPLEATTSRATTADFATLAGALNTTPRPVTGTGDSMTAQGAATLASTLPTRSVTNLGVGGQTSAEIAARSGGTPALLTASGNSINASGLTTITAWSTSLITNQGSASLTGTLGGIAGTLTATAFDGSGRATAMTFTRTTAGVATPIAAGTPFIPDLAVQRQDDIWVIWVGRNDGVTAMDNGTTEARIADQVRFIGHDRYIVCGVCNGGIASEAAGTAVWNSITALNNRLAGKYGSRFLDVRRQMIDRGLTLAGLTATANDLADIAADVIPRQLKANPGVDDIHFNTSGYTARALLVAEKITQKGW